MTQMVEKLVKQYPDIEILGIGCIDYHFSRIQYILIVDKNKTIFICDENYGDWIGILKDLINRLSFESARSEWADDEYILADLHKDIIDGISQTNLT